MLEAPDPDARLVEIEPASNSPLPCVIPPELPALEARDSDPLIPLFDGIPPRFQSLEVAPPQPVASCSRATSTKGERHCREKLWLPARAHARRLGALRTPIGRGSARAVPAQR